MDRGTLTVKNLVNDLAEVIDWKSFGVALGIKKFKLDEISMNNHGNVQQCKIAMFDRWLRNDVNASWEKVEKALNESDNEVIAKAIKDKYLSSARVSSKSKGVSIVSKGGGATGSGRSRPALKVQTQPQTQSRVMEVTTPTGTVKDELIFTQKMIEEQPEDEEEDKMVAMIKYLTTAVIDVNHIDPEDNTKNSLLHFVVKNNDIGSLKALIVFGAKVDSINAFGITPLDFAEMLGNGDAAKLLKEVGGKRGTQLSGAESKMGTQENAHARGEATNTVLVLDNSCSLAMVQLQLLYQIEVTSHKKITDIFQWIVASGVGGLLMMFMVYGKKSIGDLRKLYFQLRERVFCNNTVQDKSKELESFVVEVLGDSTRMSDVTEPKLLIGAVNKRTTHLDVKFFNNCFGDDDARIHAWKVARYTCSFPFVLGECDNYVDMGVLCKNPTDLALAKIREHVDVHGVVSLGDGILPADELGPVSLINFLSPDVDVTLSREAVSRIMTIISLYRSATNTLARETARNHTSEDARHRGYQYFRFNPLLEDEIPAAEDTNLDTLINVIFQTISYVVKNDGSELLDLLTYINNPA